MDNRDAEGVDGAKVQRACDACRGRKIRCDRGTPCSNCTSSKLNCVTTLPASKPQRQRVHISDEYEKKIDRIEERLSGIEHILETLAAKLGSLDLRKDPSDQSNQSISHKPSPGRSTPAAIPAPFEGETTINRQSEFARELLEQAVGSTPSIGQNAEIKNALTSLQDMVTRQGQYTNAMPASQPFFNRNLADLDASNLERPSWEVANEVLEKASVYPTMFLAVMFPFLKMRNMKDLFKETFLHPRESTVSHRILVFGVLYNLFVEFSNYPVLQNRVEGYRQHIQPCKTQFEIAISQLDLYLPATYENIVALLLASAFAIELCKPSLCWVLITNAAGLAQNLGYHRIQTMANDTEDERSSKIQVFWFIYMIDKTLSLRLGRASVIQDWDMSLPYPSMDDDHARFGSLVQMGVKRSSMSLYWIKVAQTQGKVYENLFSPAAFCKSREERARTATELVAALNQAWAERGEASAFYFAYTEVTPPGLTSTMTGPNPHTLELPARRKRPSATYPTPSQQSLGGSPAPRVQTMEGSSADVGNIFYLADVVSHYSTCALIQRAVSPDNVTFNQDCLESARAALVAHQRCHKQFNIKGNEDLWTGYVHWSILQSPFTPFIVIFCNAVLHCEAGDLASLSDFVHSLESCRTVSEGADRLYKMCHLFLLVAKLYVEAKTKESSQADSATAESQPQQNEGQTAGGLDVDVNTMNQFDPYLSALGLMPNSAWPMGGFPQMGAGTGGAVGQDAFPQAQGLDAGLAAGGVGVGMTLSGVNGQNNVQDWFSGSRYLMNLMEDDIQMPDFSL
ncbi:hypothetical protein CC80DRAFT_476084 [Byssothecium circinans]|uniref:Zn(2)-C6 fungal-type domain-containing protein n=1 Tax=Byssothecium circinans TaxID=147558 RepID=A0A6A5TQU8_9PLEO|nr:hypothetical protein CC80DRAFT_476084 [Byssothecium circinans]